jgi:DNA (cytosine-5)-methyltransferase 1
VQTELEAEGYEVLPFLLPACAVNAPHRRDRIWFIAYSDINGRQEFTRNLGQKNGEIKRKRNDIIFNAFESNGNERNAANTNSADNKTQSQKGILGQENKGQSTRGLIDGYTRTQWNDFPTQSPICGRDDGLPKELDNITFSKWRNESIKAYGNAIVPQVAYQIFKSICQYQKL